MELNSTPAPSEATDSGSRDNPYNALIKTCSGSAEMQARYEAHRLTRNAQQKDRFLAAGFEGVSVDPILWKLEHPLVEPGFQDPRHSLVFWARPPEHMLKLACRVQALLKEASPNLLPDLWLMPPHRMHMTALEIAHSRTPEEISRLVSALRPVLGGMTSLTYTRRARLVKPMVLYDPAAIAMTFLPAAGEEAVSPPPLPPCRQDISHPGGYGCGDGVATTDDYTYHHLRRDMFDMARAAGVHVGSRYVVPSAHITLARFLTRDDHASAAMRENWAKTVDDVNIWLEQEVWSQKDTAFVGEWIVGQEQGLDARCGALWYGGGRSITVGEGF